MRRLQAPIIQQDLEKKMVFLTGPRQVGKTTLSKSFGPLWPNFEYLNFDADRDRTVILKQQWNRQAPLIILDEVHKLKKWKSKLKGIYDTEGIPPRILVTGSARMDVYRRGGDSLAGRYFLHRLYPFSVKELEGQGSPQELLQALMQLGGFPEPFFGASQDAAERWRKQHLERIVREDIQDLEPVRDIQSLFLLVELLRERVGSPISYASLARDLQASPHTIKHWIQTLENMYVLFTVPPYHRNLSRALLKTPKIYFYDNGAVRGDEGAVLENAVAVSLRKSLHFLEDTKGTDFRLHYLRDKEKREVDFLILKNAKVDELIEVKLSDPELSPALSYYTRLLKPRASRQVLYTPTRTLTITGIQVGSAAEWLAGLDL